MMKSRRAIEPARILGHRYTLLSLSSLPASSPSTFLPRSCFRYFRNKSSSRSHRFVSGSNVASPASSYSPVNTGPGATLPIGRCAVEGGRPFPL